MSGRTCGRKERWTEPHAELQVAFPNGGFPPKVVQIPLLQRRRAMAVPKLPIGPAKVHRFLGDGSFEEQDRLLVQAPSLPLGEALKALLQVVGKAFEGDCGHDSGALQRKELRRVAALKRGAGAVCKKQFEIF